MALPQRVTFQPRRETFQDLDNPWPLRHCLIIAGVYYAAIIGAVIRWSFT